MYIPDIGYPIRKLTSAGNYEKNDVLDIRIDFTKPMCGFNLLM